MIQQHASLEKKTFWFISVFLFLFINLDSMEFTSLRQLVFTMKREMCGEKSGCHSIACS